MIMVLNIVVIIIFVIIVVVMIVTIILSPVSQGSLAPHPAERLKTMLGGGLLGTQLQHKATHQHGLPLKRRLILSIKIM